MSLQLGVGAKQAVMHAGAMIHIVSFTGTNIGSGYIRIYCSPERHFRLHPYFSYLKQGCKVTTLDVQTENRTRSSRNRLETH